MFNPARLTLARERRLITKKDLAAKAGISPVTLTRIESGGTDAPEEPTIEALASALNYPSSFFFLGDPEVLQESSVSFRRMSSTTAGQQKAARWAGSLAYEIDDWVHQRFNLPKPEVPDLREESPENAALSLRSMWGVGFKPIKHIISLLETNGVRVFSLDESNCNVDAFSVWRGTKPYVFLNTQKSAERSRFDAAHELGHLVLHQHGLLQEPGGIEKKEREKEADRFASAFLMPREDLIARVPSFPSLGDLIKLKSRWGVSVAALAKSAFDAGLVSDWHYRALCRELSAAGYRKKEPAPMPRERSVAWEKILRSLWSEGHTKQRISSALSLPIDELEALIKTVVDDEAQKEAEKARSGNKSGATLRLVHSDG